MIGSIAHLAYHLGAVRQIARGAPRSEGGDVRDLVTHLWPELVLFEDPADEPACGTVGTEAPTHLTDTITAVPLHIQMIQMGTAYWVSSLVYTAAKIGLADALEAGPRSAKISPARTA